MAYYYHENLFLWILDAVRFFRPLGFFTPYHDQLDYDVATIFTKLYDENWGMQKMMSGLADGTELDVSEILLLSLDTSRVWVGDCEDEMLPNGYHQVLTGWAGISRGSFAPEQIHQQVQETFDHNNHRFRDIAITFVHRNQQIQLLAQGTTLDFGILQPVNDLIRLTSDIQLAQYFAFDQSAYIIALTAAEKQYLIEQRGWRFE